MKFKTSLIFSLVLTGVLFTNTALAYCVFNESSINVMAFDSRYNVFKKYWMDNDMKPGDYGCCPGGEKECENAKIDVYAYPGELPPTCRGDTPVAAHGWINITGDSQALVCTAYNSSTNLTVKLHA